MKIQKKSNTRAARKKSQKVKLGMSPILREVRELNTKIYAERSRALDSVKELLESEINAPWLEPHFMRATREEVPLLTQSELARASGVSRVLINNYETGISIPTVETAAILYEEMERRGSRTATWVMLAVSKIIKKVAWMTLAILDDDEKWQKERRQSVMESLARQEKYSVEIFARIKERSAKDAECPWLPDETKELLREGTPVTDGLLTETKFEKEVIS